MPPSQVNATALAVLKGCLLCNTYYPCIPFPACFGGLKTIAVAKELAALKKASVEYSISRLRRGIHEARMAEVRT